jgi:hypothetical protein
MSGEISNQHKLMKIPCSNCRATCVRVLLSETVSLAAPAIEPPLVTGLGSDKDWRICLPQASSTWPAALGDNLLSDLLFFRQSRGKIADDGLLNDIVYRHEVLPNDIAPPTGIGL